MTTVPLTLKQGDTFGFAMQFSNADGSPANLTGATITANLYAATGIFIVALTVTATNLALGQASISGVSSATWSPQMYQTDIKVVTADGFEGHSDTIMIKVNPAVTA